MLKNLLRAQSSWKVLKVKTFLIKKIQKLNIGLMDKPKFGTKMENVYICYLQKHKVKGTALDLVILELKGIVCDRFIKKTKLWVHSV